MSLSRNWAPKMSKNHILYSIQTSVASSSILTHGTDGQGRERRAFNAVKRENVPGGMGFGGGPAMQMATGQIINGLVQDV